MSYFNITKGKNMITRPIIFLDMDGVMNNDSAFIRANLGIYPPNNISAMTVSHMCVSRLKRICDTTNADIVISSSWRSRVIDDLTFSNIHGNLSVLHALEWAEFDCKKLIIGNTPHMDNAIRGTEINCWLANRSDRYIKNITPYIILDDDSDFTKIQKANHFVKTNPRIGLSENDTNKAIELINLQIERNKENE